MLSFMKDEDDQDDVLQENMSSKDMPLDEEAGETDKNTDQIAQESVHVDKAPSLTKTLSQVSDQEQTSDQKQTSSQDFLAPSSSGRKLKYSTMILGAVFLIGVASLFLAIKKFGPAEAQAGPSEQDIQIERDIAKLVGSRAAINNKMNDVVDRISKLSDVEQISVDELKRNPFLKEPLSDDDDNLLLVEETEDGEVIQEDESVFKLWSIMEFGSKKSCMIDDRVYVVGDRIGNYQIKLIGEEFVELGEGERIVVLRMQK